MYLRFMLDHFYEPMVDSMYKKRKGRKIDWNNPRNINEKVFWLMSRSGKIYFGELTFSSGGGMMSYFTDDYLVELGRQCVLPVEGKTKG